MRICAAGSNRFLDLEEGGDFIVGSVGAERSSLLMFLAHLTGFRIVSTKLEISTFSSGMYFQSSLLINHTITLP